MLRQISLFVITLLVATACQPQTNQEKAAAFVAASDGGDILILTLDKPVELNKVREVDLSLVLEVREVLRNLEWIPFSYDPSKDYAECEGIIKKIGNGNDWGQDSTNQFCYFIRPEVVSEWLPTYHTYSPWVNGFIVRVRPTSLGAKNAIVDVECTFPDLNHIQLRHLANKT